MVSKRFLSHSVSVFLLIMSLELVTLKEAHAYVDLGSASFLLQMLLAGLFASLFTIKLWWHKITSSVARLMGRNKAAKGNGG